MQLTITIPDCTCRTNDTAAGHHEFACPALLFWLRWPSLGAVAD